MATISDEDEENDDDRVPELSGDSDDEVEIQVVEKKGRMTKVLATLDSGAGAHVCPKRMFPRVKCVRDGKPKKMVAANGTIVKDLGAKTVDFCAEKGQKRRIKFRAADVLKPLISVGLLVRRGHQVNLKQEKPEIVSPDGSRTPVHLVNNVYVVEVWVDEDVSGPVFSRPE